MAESHAAAVERLRKQMGEAVKIDVPKDMIEVREPLDENGVARVAVPGGAALHGGGGRSEVPTSNGALARCVRSIRFKARGA